MKYKIGSYSVQGRGCLACFDTMSRNPFIDRSLSVEPIHTYSEEHATYVRAWLHFQAQAQDAPQLTVSHGMGPSYPAYVR